MITIITLVILTPEEREVLINFSADEIGKLWAEVDTTIQKYANKCIKQGWEQTSETRHTDGSWQGATFRAPATAISIRNPNAKRTMSDEQKQAMAERMKLMREKKGNNEVTDDENNG